MEDDILIDNYLKGLLSEKEEQAFRERLSLDVSFKEQFDLEYKLFNAFNEDSWSYLDRKSSEVDEYKNLLEGDDMMALKKTLSETNEAINSKTSSNRRNIFIYLVAASVVLFLGFQIFFNQDMSNQELYDSYVGLDDLPSFVSRSDVPNSLSKAQELFEAGNYKDAINLFESAQNGNNNLAQILIYKGLAYTELEELDEAQFTFDELINSNLLDAEKGYWYKALTYLKSDQVEEAKAILKKIVAENLYSKSKAEELLDTLN